MFEYGEGIFIHDCGALSRHLAKSETRTSRFVVHGPPTCSKNNIKYIGLLVALLPRSKTNKNTIFKVLYLQLHLVVKTHNAKPTWLHTIDGCCDGVNRRNFHVQCKTSLTCYRQKTVRNCLIFCPRSQKRKTRSVTPKAATWFQRPKSVLSRCKILWNHTANLLSVCSFENNSEIKYKQSQNNRN